MSKFKEYCMEIKNMRRKNLHLKTYIKSPVSQLFYELWPFTFFCESHYIFKILMKNLIIY